MTTELVSGPGIRATAVTLLKSPARATSPAGDGATAASAAILLVVLVIGLVTAGDYGATIDEFNTNDYGPKALSWYTSGFTDRSQFETVEFPLWYYGPWFQMLTATVQSLKFADALTIRHALTFVAGFAGIAALLPIARLSFGAWIGPLAMVLCLLTGYVYGNLFFAPIDVPFLAAMCWATFAVMAMARTIVPTWPATVGAGIASGLAIATRTGGIISHAYLIGAMGLCALEAVLVAGRAARQALFGIAGRSLVAIALAWLLAFAVWPWLQIGNPLAQFKIAYVHFATISTQFEFDHWGERLSTTSLPWSYIPEQWFARLPVGFVALLASAFLLVIPFLVRWVRLALAACRRRGSAGLRRPMLLLARSRNILLVWIAAVVPVAFLMIRHATLYDGVRHTLFVIPMLALLAGWAAVRLWRGFGGARPVAALLAVLYAAALISDLVVLHPLEYIAMNTFAGGVSGAYGRFDLDYWSAATSEALQRLEARLDRAGVFANSSPGILICIPYRESMVRPMLHGKWRIELDPNKADFVIESERSRCAAGNPNLVMFDKITRYERAFAWTYVNRRSNPGLSSTGVLIRSSNGI